MTGRVGVYSTIRTIYPKEPLMRTTTRRHALFSLAFIASVGLAATLPAGFAAAQPQRMEARLSPLVTLIHNNQTESPLLRVGHIPAVEVMVNGEGPYLFAIDTGASGSLHLDSAFVNEAGLPVIGRTIAKDGATGNDIPMERVDVGVIEIGGARFEGVRGSSRDYSQIASALGAPLAGIIGFGLFADCVVTIDYPANRLMLEQGVTLPKPSATNGVVAIETDRGIPVFEMAVAGRRVPIDLDTGSRGRMTFPEDVFGTFELLTEKKVVGQARSITSSFAISQAQLKGAVRWAGYELNNPLIETGPTLQAHVGEQLLSNFSLTFDQRNKRMRFARPAGAAPLSAAPTAPQRGRLGIKPAIMGDRVVIEMVVPDSPAFFAGIREGDRIVAINGKPIEELMGPGLGREFGVRPTVVCTVERDGEEMAIAVTVE